MAANRKGEGGIRKGDREKVIVPPHHDIMGAIGSAITLWKKRHGKSRGLKGLTCGTRDTNLLPSFARIVLTICEIRQVNIEGENPLYYGSRCGKFDDERALKKASIYPDSSRNERMHSLIPIRKTNPINR